jgi:hypothetical protein
MTKQGKAAQGKSVTPVGRTERVKIAKRLAKRYDSLRKKYPEVHGKVEDFVSNSVDDGTLYFTIGFTDKTQLTLRYRSRMTASGADLFDIRSGDLDLIRRYMRPSSVSFEAANNCAVYCKVFSPLVQILLKTDAIFGSKTRVPLSATG